jgi:hypothetical protein
MAILAGFCQPALFTFYGNREITDSVWPVRMFKALWCESSVQSGSSSNLTEPQTELFVRFRSLAQNGAPDRFWVGSDLSFGSESVLGEPEPCQSGKRQVRLWASFVSLERRKDTKDAKT